MTFLYHSKFKGGVNPQPPLAYALDWESHKSLKHDGECLTELLERALFQFKHMRFSESNKQR